MKHRTAIISGNPVEVTWTESEHTVEATVGGRHYKIEKRRLGPQLMWFGVEGVSAEVAVISTESGYDVSVNGNRIPVEFADSSRKVRRHGPASDGVASLRAPMPGKIVRVLQSVGSVVEAHQGIVVMEAMKMQNEIRSPKRGKVARLNVGEGDAVTLGQVIAEVE